VFYFLWPPSWTTRTFDTFSTPRISRPLGKNQNTLPRTESDRHKQHYGTAVGEVIIASRFQATCDVFAPLHETRYCGKHNEQQVVGCSRHWVSRGGILLDRETANPEDEPKPRQRNIRPSSISAWCGIIDSCAVRRESDLLRGLERPQREIAHRCTRDSSGQSGGST
jgi:hypothetical protein